MATPIPANDARFLVSEIALAVDGVVTGASDITATGVVIDSRAVRPGNLFVALCGETHDGHDYLSDVAERGAAAAIVSRDVEPGAYGGMSCLRVSDTLRALGDLATVHRRRWSGTVIAITGSAGKTGTKELTSAGLMATGARVLKTPGNLNNLIGLPMTVLLLSEEFDHAVLELGTSQPGEIARLSHIARPEVGVVTLVAAAHTEGLGDVEAVAKEKSDLLAALHSTGTAVVNGDDGTLLRWAEKHNLTSTVYFGRSVGAQVRLTSHRIDTEMHTVCTYEVDGNSGELSLRLGLLGEAAALNAAAALTVIRALGRDMRLGSEGLCRVKPMTGRMCPRRARSGARILDDSYNANPRSVALALDTATEIAQVHGGKVVGVLGDMKELGARSQREHAAVVQHAVSVGLRALVACGPEMCAAAETLASPRSGIEIRKTRDSEETAVVVKDLMRPDDVVLIKGSRSMGLERVVDAIALPEVAP